MPRLLTKIMLGAALTSSIALMPVVVKAEQPPRYQDRDHHDEHEWNEAEDRAYRRYLQEKRMTYREYRRLKNKEQREYWRWRHEHKDNG